MKLLTSLLITAAILPATTVANSADLGYLRISTKLVSGKSMFAETYITKLDQVGVMFSEKDEDCIMRDDKLTSSYDRFKINGVYVKIASMCTSESYRGYYPQTKKGFDYIVTQFKKSKFVHVQRHVFNAKGFTKAYNEELKRAAAL